MKSPIEVFLVFDLETTGLNTEKNAIIEIACCPFDINLKDLPEYTSGIMNIYGEREIQPKALEVNGVTMQQIKSGRDPKEVVKEFVKYIKSLAKPNKIILVGHNIDKFDIPFLNNYLEFYGIDLSKIVNDKLTIDTMWWSHIMFPESVNYKLGTMCSNLGVELVNAHRALTDTRANKELIKKMFSNMRNLSSSKQDVVKEHRFRENFSL